MHFVKIRYKKGEFLEEEVLKIIIAVLGLLLLVLLAVNLYSLFRNTTRIEQAKNNLEEISRIMIDLKEGEKKSFALLSPSRYLLTSWPLEGTALPSQCSGKGWSNCICLCEFDKGDKSNDGIKKILNVVIGPLVVIDAMKEIYKDITIKNFILDECNAKSTVCVNAIKPVKINSISDFDKMSKADIVAMLIDKDFRVEKYYAISIDDLLKYKRNIEIKLENGVFVIQPE